MPVDEALVKPWRHYCAMRIHASVFDCLAAIYECFRIDRESVLDQVERFWNPHGFSLAVLSVRRWALMLHVFIYSEMIDGVAKLQRVKLMRCS